MPRQRKNPEKENIKPYVPKTIPFSRVDVQLIENLVKQGVFTSFSDCVRTAVREWIYARTETTIKNELLGLQGDMIFDREAIKTMLTEHLERKRLIEQKRRLTEQKRKIDI